MNTEAGPCEDIVRRQPSAHQERGFEKPNPPTL